jgi:hypothetical protein
MINNNFNNNTFSYKWSNIIKEYHDRDKTHDDIPDLVSDNDISDLTSDDDSDTLYGDLPKLASDDDLPDLVTDSESDTTYDDLPDLVSDNESDTTYDDLPDLVSNVNNSNVDIKNKNNIDPYMNSAFDLIYGVNRSNSYIPKPVYTSTNNEDIKVCDVSNNLVKNAIVNTDLSIGDTTNPVKIDQIRNNDTDLSINGITFNNIYKSAKLIKLTNANCVHNGFKFYEGENVDCNTFTSNTSCGPDGIYFCTLDELEQWLDYSHNTMTYIWDVKIPFDAKTMIYNEKFKTDRIILLNKRLISDYIAEKLTNMICSSSTSDIITYMSSLPKRFVETCNFDEQCLMLLKIDPEIFIELPESCKTVKVCTEYINVSNSTNIYDHIPSIVMSKELLDICIKKNPSIYLTLDPEDRTQEMADRFIDTKISNYADLLYAHKNYTNTLSYITNVDSKDVNTAAIPLEFLKFKEIANIVVKIDGSLLGYVEYRLKTYQMCIDAITQNPMAFRSVPFGKRTKEIYDIIAKDSQCIFLHYKTDIPSEIKTEEFNNRIITTDPMLITQIPIEDLTVSNMITYITTAQSVYGQHYTSKMMLDIGIKYNQFFKTNMYNIIDQLPEISNALSETIIRDSLDSYKMMELLVKHIDILKNNPQFLSTHELRVYAISKGGLFYKNSYCTSLTVDKINDFIRARPYVIHEIPSRYLDDFTYIICIKEFGMKLSNIPIEFHTSELINCAITCNPSEFEFNESNLRIDNNLE